MTVVLLKKLKENRCWSAVQPHEIKSFIDSHSKGLVPLIKLAASHEKDFAFRCTWVLFKGTDKNDHRIKPFLKDLIAGIKNKKSGHKRELIRLILKHDLPIEHEGEMYNQCVTVWKDLTLQPGTRYYAFLFLHRLLIKYPELKNELNYLFTLGYVKSLSPGIKKSVQKKTLTFL